MKYFRLVLAALFAKKIRTFLTLASLIMAYLLFGLLQAVNVLFNTAGDGFSGATRIVTQSRVFRHKHCRCECCRRLNR